MPYVVTRPLHASDRLAAIESLQQLVGDHMYDLMDDSAHALFDKSKDLTAEDPTFWYRLFSAHLSRVAPRPSRRLRPRRMAPSLHREASPWAEVSPLPHPRPAAAGAAAVGPRAALVRDHAARMGLRGVQV